MTSWEPSASLTTLQQRASIIRTVREFFYERQVLEVDTPVLSHATVTDPFIVRVIQAFFRVAQDTAHCEAIRW